MMIDTKNLKSFMLPTILLGGTVSFWGNATCSIY